MRFINSGLNVQFHGKDHSASGWVVTVTNEDDWSVVLDTMTLGHRKVSAEEFEAMCVRWLNQHDNDQIEALRQRARAAEQRMRGFHQGATEFDAETEAKLDAIARLSGRNDIYLGTKQEMGRQMFVLGPWLRGLTGDRYYYSASLVYVQGFITRAYEKVTAPGFNAEEWRQMRQGGLPTGTSWVVGIAARHRGVDETVARAVDIGSIGNGGHVVTWTDGKTGYYTTEDYNNIDIFHS
jgi:hypothetical protein